MHSVRVNKDTLLETLRSNLEKHRREFEEAEANYPQVVIDTLRKRASQIEAGNPVDLRFDLPQPRSYVDEYEDAIQMLEWSTEDEIELAQHEFKQYVQDEWDWKQAFASSTMNYR